MTLPNKLDQLPLDLLLKINESCFSNDAQSVSRFYLRLSIVNWHFHETFMSDHIWAKLDAHCVETNISAHYLKFRAAMSHKESVLCGKFDFGRWRHPAVNFAQFNELSFYTQGNILAESHGVDTEKYHFNELVGDRDLLLYAARTRKTRFKDDKKVVLAHFAKLRGCLNKVSEALRDDPEVALAAIARDPWNHEWCSKRLKNNREVVEAAVKSDGAILKFSSARLSCELVSKAFKPTHKPCPTCKSKAERGVDPEESHKRPRS